MFEWLYQRMTHYYELMNGENLSDNHASKIENEYKAFLGEGADPNLPLFLNRGFAAFGSISILKSKRKVKRGIDQWKQEDLEIIEIGNREFHEQQLPVITLEKVLCTPEDHDNVAGCVVMTRVFRNREELLHEFETRFAFRKTIQGIQYLERMKDYDGYSSLVLETLLKEANVDLKHDFITLKYTIILPNKKEEDFEFEVMALSKSFYVKAVNYIDFFDRKFVLVIKSLKLHNNCSFDDFTEAFDGQNVFVDDFNSSRLRMPDFSPSIYHLLNKALLSERLKDFFQDDFLTSEDVEDEYTNKFYTAKFAQMRYDLIESNFVKAKLDTKVWWEFAQSLKPTEELFALLGFTPCVYELTRLRETLGAYICTDDRRGFNDILCMAVIGIKSEVRPIFWQKVCSKDGRQRVTEQLNYFTPKIVDQLYKMVNMKNTYEVKCLFRNHQRVVTHYMKILEEVYYL